MLRKTEALQNAASARGKFPARPKVTTVKLWGNQIGSDVDEGTTFLRVVDAWLDLDCMPACARPPSREQHGVRNADAGTRLVLPDACLVDDLCAVDEDASVPGFAA